MFVLFFKQKTAYEMRISDWSSDVCSSDLLVTHYGTVKLIDFGIARLADSGVQAPGAESASRSSLQNLSLTPGYAAPERMTGSEVTTEIGRASCRERVCQDV